jgi:hypothetical protein
MDAFEMVRLCTERQQGADYAPLCFCGERFTYRCYADMSTGNIRVYDECATCSIKREAA